MNLKSIQKYIELVVKKRTFVFDGAVLPLFFHSYNNFGLTERCMEIPIIKYYLGKYPHDNVLEIGNVSKHYYDDFKDFKKKDTVDKYEIAYDVINIDIRDFNPKKKYDFIYSISTFEHMDSDDGRNPDYIQSIYKDFSSQAFGNMDYVINRLLADKGKFIITFPLEYCNAEIDNSLRNREWLFFNAKVNVYCLKWHSKYLCVMEITK